MSFIFWLIKLSTSVLVTLFILYPKPAAGQTDRHEAKYKVFVESLKLDPSSEPSLKHEIENFNKLIARRSWQAACQAYGVYFKKRMSIIPPFPPVNDWIDADVAYGTRALNGEFNFMGQWYHIDSNVNWHTREHGLEWLAALHRQYHVAKMASSYEKTGDERYASEALRLMLSWIREADEFVLPPGQYDPFWNVLNVSERINIGWNGALKWIWNSNSFNSDCACEITRSMALHADILFAAQPQPGNIGMLQNKALLILGVMLKEHMFAGLWRQRAIERMVYRAERDFYPDGSGVELAFGYGNSVVESVLAIKRILDLNPQFGSFPVKVWTFLERYYEYVMSVAKPTGFAPNLGDTHNAIFSPFILQTAAQQFPHRLDFKWFASGVGDPPPYTSVAHDFSGHYVMRSDWGRDAKYLHFDGGPFGDGFHGHEDKLSFIASAFGKEIFVEAGGWFPYGNFPEFRYARSSFAHNTLAVDGYSQSSRLLSDRDGKWFHKHPYISPLDNPWFSTANLDFVSAQYDLGFGPQLTRVQHRRSIFFIKNRYWLIIDSIEPRDGIVHECQMFFHMPALNLEVEGNELIVDYGDGVHMTGQLLSKANLTKQIIAGKPEAQNIPVWTPETMTSDNLMQGYAGILGDWKPIPTLVVSAKSNQPIHIVSIWYPYQQGSDMRIMSSTAGKTSVDSITISLQWSNDTSESFKLSNHNGIMSFEAKHAGEAAWVEAKEFRIAP